MITNAISAQAVATVDWPMAAQAIAAVVAAVGTVVAVSISLCMAWRNRLQFQMTTRLNVLPTLIREAESAARRLERNGLFFPRGGPGVTWDPPSELRALKVALSNLKSMEIQNSITLNHVIKQSAMETVTSPETANDRINTHKLLISVLEELIQLREEFLELANKTSMKK